MADSTPVVTPKPWYLDPATYLMVLGILVPLLNKRLHLDLDPQQIAEFLATVVGFFALHKWQSGVVQAASIRHAATVQAAQVHAAALSSPQAAADAVNKL